MTDIWICSLHSMPKELTSCHSVNTFTKVSGLYKSRFILEKCWSQLSPSKMIPYLVIPALTFTPAICNLLLKAWQSSQFCLNTDFNTLIMILCSVRCLAIVLVQELLRWIMNCWGVTLSWCRVCQWPNILLLLRIFRLNKTGWSKLLQKILFMACTSSIARWAG